MRNNLAIKAPQQCANIVQSLQYNARPLHCKKNPENKLRLFKHVFYQFKKQEEQG